MSKHQWGGPFATRFNAYNQEVNSRPSPYLPDPELPVKYGVYNGYMPVSQEAKASAKKYYQTKIVPQLEANNQLGMTADEYTSHRWEIEKPDAIQESVYQIAPQDPKEVTMGSANPFANHAYGPATLNRRNKYARKMHRLELREDRLRNRFINAAANGQINRTARLAEKLNDFE